MEKNYKFTETWFDIAIPIWKQVFETYQKPKKIGNKIC
jgi:hypothetical protein